jgi:hypothetical protein
VAGIVRAAEIAQTRFVVDVVRNLDIVEGDEVGQAARTAGIGYWEVVALRRGLRKADRLAGMETVVPLEGKDCGCTSCKFVNAGRFESLFESGRMNECRINKWAKLASGGEGLNCEDKRLTMGIYFCLRSSA